MEKRARTGDIIRKQQMQGKRDEKKPQGRSRKRNTTIVQGGCIGMLGRRAQGNRGGHVKEEVKAASRAMGIKCHRDHHHTAPHSPGTCGERNNNTQCGVLGPKQS